MTHDHRLLELVAFLTQELDLVLADLDRVVVLQQLLLDGAAIDVGAIGAVEVFNEHVAAHHLEHGMFPADSQVVDHDVVVRTAAQGVTIKAKAKDQNMAALAPMGIGRM